MSYLQSKKIKVHLETPDGLIFMGESLMASINIDRGYETAQFGSSAHHFTTGLAWDIELQGIGNPTWQHGGDLAPGIAARFLPREWQCEYCGRANELKQQQCQSCGWYRGLFVDVAQEAGVWRVRR